MALGHWLKDYIGPHSGGSGGDSGGGTEPLIVSKNKSGQLDHTWQEIYDAFPNVVFDGGNAEFGVYLRNPIKSVSGDNNQYLVVVNDDSYSATSTSGYPKGEPIKSVGGDDNQYPVVVNDVSYSATSTSGYPKGKQ